MNKILAILYLIIITGAVANGQDKKIKTSAKGQFSTWSVLNFGDDTKEQLGSRFIPILNIEKLFSGYKKTPISSLDLNC